MRDLSAESCSRLSAHLARVAPSLGPLQSAKPIGEGQSNPTFLLTCDDGHCVLRMKPPGVLLPSAHAIDREFRVLSALAPTDVAVPAPIHYCADATIVGTEFYLMQYVPGRVFADSAMAGLAPDEKRQAYVSLVSTLARLHRLDPVRLGLADFGKHGGFKARQLATWTRQYEASSSAENPDMRVLQGWLQANLTQADEPVTIVHGDYRAGNVIFAADDARVAAIVDWEISTLGDPFMDLAYLLVFMRMPHDSPLQGVGGLDRKREGIPDEQTLIDLYCNESGRDLPTEWPFMMVLNFFRLAAILQGIQARALLGNAAGARAREVGETGSIVAALGREYVEKQG